MAFDLPTTTLGRTGLTVTRLGIGGAYCQTPDGYRAALDCGVTYLDTARVYRDGDDERVVGEALAGRRHEITLASKTQSRDAAGARQDLETSLRLLGTDYLDIWQIHYLNTEPERSQVLGPGGAFETALQAREQGLVRFIGVTGHIWPEVAKAVETGQFDTVLCWYNAAMPEPEADLFPRAIAQKTGVVIMHTTAAGKLLDADDAPPQADLYRYVLGHPAVNVALLGLRDPDQFRRLARALSERITIEPDERQRLQDYATRMRAAGKLG